MDQTKSNHTILVIDDDPMILNLADLMLQKQGFSTLLAGDGSEGLAAFKEHREIIDLVLVDMLMPKMNGEQLTAEILRLSPGFKIIMLTGYGANLEELNGVSDIVSKPISLDQLNEKIRQALQ